MEKQHNAGCVKKHTVNIYDIRIKQHQVVKTEIKENHLT